MNIIESTLKFKSFEQTVQTRAAVSDNMICMYVFAHGAGAGISHQFMRDIQEALLRVNIASFTFNFLFRELGKRTPYRMTKPIQVFEEVWTHVKNEYKINKENLPMFAGGKSYGGRVASMSDLPDCRGFIFLGYPFHPADNTTKLRTEQLYKISLPMLFIQGDRDTLSTRDVVSDFLGKQPSADILWLPDGDHSWKPRKRSGYTQEKLMEMACARAIEFIEINI